MVIWEYVKVLFLRGLAGFIFRLEVFGLDGIGLFNRKLRLF